MKTFILILLFFNGPQIAVTTIPGFSSYEECTADSGIIKTEIAKENSWISVDSVCISKSVKTVRRDKNVD